MLDRIYFTIPNYCPEKNLGIGYNSLKRIVIDKTGELVDKQLYKIPGFDLIYSETTNSTAVNGSIRKFYFGKDSLKDFENKEDLKIGLFQLSELLNLPYKRLLNCGISNIEIGKNFIVDIECSVIIDSIVKYSVLRPHKIGDNSIKFNGSIHDLSIYDKLAEICSKNNTENKSYIKTIHEGKNYLRIELRLKKKTAVNHRLFGYGNTLHDLLAFFDFLPYILIREIERLEFLEEKIKTVNAFNGNNIKELNDFLMALGLQQFGLNNTINTAIKFLGIDKSRYHISNYRKLASLVKLKVSNKNNDLLISFRKQLNVSNEGLEGIDIASEEFCYDVSFNKII